MEGKRDFPFVVVSPQCPMCERWRPDLLAAGGDVRFTVYPELGHDSWTATYAIPELYIWLLEQRRPSGA